MVADTLKVPSKRCSRRWTSVVLPTPEGPLMTRSSPCSEGVAMVSDAVLDSGMAGILFATGKLRDVGRRLGAGRVGVR